MKKTVSAVLLLTIAASFIFGSCSKKSGEEGFYEKKTSSSAVVEIRMEKKSYEASGDLRVRAAVGFGHLTESSGGENGDHLRVEYFVSASSRKEDERPAWEMVTDYESSFYSETFSAQKDGGEYCPNFKDEVTLTFPEEVERGYLDIQLSKVAKDGEAKSIVNLRIYFERKDGVLTLDP